MIAFITLSFALSFAPCLLFQTLIMPMTREQRERRESIRRQVELLKSMQSAIIAAARSRNADEFDQCEAEAWGLSAEIEFEKRSCP